MARTLSFTVTTLCNVKLPISKGALGEVDDVTEGSAAEEAVLVMLAAGLEARGSVLVLLAAALVETALIVFSTESVVEGSKESGEDNSVEGGLLVDELVLICCGTVALLAILVTVDGAALN